MDRTGPVRSSRMPSCTEEQKRRAVEMVEECGGSVTRAMRRLGIPHAPQVERNFLLRQKVIAAPHLREVAEPWLH